MNAKRRRRRRSGSLGSLKSSLWAVIEFSVGLVEDVQQPPELRLKGCHALSQAAMTYYKILEGAELQVRVQALEERLTHAKP